MSRHNGRRVVVTGLGAVSGFGVGLDCFWNGLRAGDCAIRHLDAGTKDYEGGVACIGAVVPEFEPAKYFGQDQIALLDRFSQFAILAAQEAASDAGLEPDSEALLGAGAVIGTGCGGKQTDEESYTRLYKESRPRVHPLTIPRGMPSAAASLVSQDLGIRGPVFSVASACASAAHAIAQGRLMIMSGLVDVVLVGGADAPFTYGLLKAWEALRVMSGDMCRPFSKGRSGMALGEGAGVVVLESAEHAVRRGVRIYAELAGYGLSSDAGHITRPDPEGVAKAVSGALRDAGLQPQQVDYVNAHGTGTLTNDLVETKALHGVFGDHARSLVISSTKSMHGHALGAASGLELIATVRAITAGLVPPTANYLGPDGDCDIDCIPNEPREMTVNVALSNSFAFGGLNAVLAVRAWDS